MPTGKHPSPQVTSRRRSAWLRRVRELLTQAEAWAAAEGWRTEEEQKSVSETGLGEYRAPVLRIHRPGGYVELEPIALRVGGAKGRVDLRAWPTLDRVKLLLRNGGWEILTDSNVFLREPWSRETFVRLTDDLLA